MFTANSDKNRELNKNYKWVQDIHTEIVSPYSFIRSIDEIIQKECIASIIDLSSKPLFNQLVLQIKSLFSMRNNENDFVILDYWLPSEYEAEKKFKAFYLTPNNDNNEYLIKHAKRLTELYKNPKIVNKIFDSNKILEALSSNYPERYMDNLPYLILTKNKTGISENEFHIQFESNEINEPKDNFEDFIEKVYSEAKSENQNIDKCVLINDLLNEKQSLTSGKIEFSDINKAFYTYLEFFKTIVPFNDYKEFIYFPAITNVIEEDKITKRWVGGMLVPFKTESTYFERKNYQTFVQNNVISIYQTFQYALVLDQTKKAKYHATKSAISAIMARNMSHNLGSHVLSNLKTKTNSVTDIVKNELLENLVNKNYQIKGYDAHKVQETIEQEGLPFLLGTNRFYQYLQERQDFIATISTWHIPYFAPVNFKDSIYDELNWDKRVKRHNLQGRDVVNILLDNIARAEGVSRNQLEINYGEFKGDKTKPGTQADKDLSDLRKKNIDLPAGIIGRQALFSIMENIIRNSAKHSKKDLAKLKFTIELKDSSLDPSLLEITIYDNCQDVGSLICIDKEADKIYALTDEERRHIDDQEIEENKIYQYANIFRIKKGIDSPLTNEDGSLNESNKGLKEIKISAAWLRNLDFNEVENRNSNIVRVFNKKKNIAYQFNLLKSRKVAVLLTQKLKNKYFSKELSDKCIYEGWYFLTVDEYKNEKCKSYRYVIYSKSVKQKMDADIKQLSPTRFFEYPKIEIFEKILESDNFSNDKKINLLNAFYHVLDKRYIKIIDYWIGKRFGRERPTISIYDKIRTSVSSTKKEEKKLESYYPKIELSLVKNSISFLKHLNEYSNKELEELIKNEKPRFLETITGDNSTDRLVRNSILNETWYLNMFESTKTKVLILDERIWSRITGEEKSLYVQEFDKFLELKENEKDFNKYFNEKKFLKYPSFTFTDLNHKNKNELAEFISERDVNIKRLNDENIKQHILFKNKEVDIFSIDILGDLMILFDTESKIRNIFRTASDLNFKVFNDYHFVSVHHSLTQKISEGLNTQGGPKAIYEKMINSITEKRPGKKTKIFIHSGRSRPDSNEIPDLLPFIQYSSIENAIFDCKYTLTEQLYAAHGTK